jgi:hypothetical protein
MPSAADLDRDYAKDFWNLANIIIGFAVVQSITFAIAIGPKTSDLAVTISKQVTFVASLVGIATILYVLAVGYCQWVNWRLLGNNMSPELAGYLKIWNIVRLVAVALIGLSGLPPVLSLWPK